MKSNKILHPTLSIFWPIGLLLFFLLFSQCQTLNENYDSGWNSTIDNQPTSNQHSKGVTEKQKGAHVFGRMDSSSIQHLIGNKLEWVTLVSWGNQDVYDSPIMDHHNGDSVRLRRTDSTWVKRIEFARAAGFKVFVKPHIWVRSSSKGKWRSDIYPANEEDWEVWKKNYRDYILRFATIAEQAHAEMFCIGTELSRLSVEKPDFWKSLIPEVRNIYSGKITYAANWYNEYEKITFWDQLDYIGVQAYFPLVKNECPSVKQISKGWIPYISDLESIHKKYNRDILFTEMGYKSSTDSAIEPWRWVETSPDHKNAVSLETQANCYQAFFNTVWKKKWFAGVHLWQMRSDYVAARGGNNSNFTPQGKPAELIIAKGFE